jgi:hypothetical protein
MGIKHGLRANKVPAEPPETDDMTTRGERRASIRLWVGGWTALFLVVGSAELHGPATNASTLITSSPVLADSECGGGCEHFDRYEGQLLPEHPSARLKKQLFLSWRPPTLTVPLTTTASLRFVEPAIKELALAMLLPARAPPAG